MERLTADFWDGIEVLGNEEEDGWHRGQCPVCPERTGKIDHRHSLSWNTSIGRYVCHKCGISGRLPKAKRSSRQEIVLRHIVEWPRFTSPEGAFPLWQDPGLTSHALAPARSYLQRRGVADIAVWQRFQVYGCLDGLFDRRILLPVLGLVGEWLGYSARDWTNESNLKYRNPKYMQKKHILFNMSALFEIARPYPLLVMEGVFDVIRYGDDAVACLGKPSSHHVDTLARSHRPICVVLDGDACEESQALARRLKLRGKAAAVLRLPPKQDPGEVDPDWLREAAKEAVTAQVRD